MVIIHRWLSIPLSLLFVMWFASGIVMHFVPFPELTAEERFAGLPTLDFASIKHSPAEAIAKSGLQNVRRVRLWQRSDAPIYLVLSASGMASLRANDLKDANVVSGRLALDIANEHAALRGLDISHATLMGSADYDQWTVSNGLDPHRPLHRIALNDAAGTEIYVSSRTGEVVRDTTRNERGWNYVGSVAHWIYPTVLRKDHMIWNVAVWWLSLIAVVAAISGVIVGVFRLKAKQGRLVSPYRRWHAWHHWLGLACTFFLITWIVSGWLSMDHGRFFSTSQVSAAEARSIAGSPDWSHLELPSPNIGAYEVEWFAFGNQIYQRQRTSIGEQQLKLVGQPQRAQSRAFLSANEIRSVLSQSLRGCTETTIVSADDSYPISPVDMAAPVFRTVCGSTWYHIDGASGANLERLDPRRRAYRWLYRALHTLDFSALIKRPLLRTILIVALCLIGVAFSVTGVIVAWRRLRITFS